tara:strand:- start:416 stop:985 length:570 start_codon:yes stop_codon:yes gene_type:complete
MSTLAVNQITTQTGSTITVNSDINSSNITVPTTKKLIGTDSGSIVSPDMVIQCVTAGGSDTFNTSSSSWVQAPVSCNITTKEANSKLLVQATVAVWRSSSGNYFGVRSRNGPQGGSIASPATWGDGYMSSGNISWDTTYQHMYTAGAVGVYTNYYEVYANGASLWFPNNSGSYGSSPHRWHMTIWEIAQ